jgi:hypothetical protein
VVAFEAGIHAVTAMPCPWRGRWSGHESEDDVQDDGQRHGQGERHQEHEEAAAAAACHSWAPSASEDDHVDPGPIGLRRAMRTLLRDRGPRSGRGLLGCLDA